ncbi:hypothetical protein D3C85_1511130 [compost metagenome]
MPSFFAPVVAIQQIQECLAQALLNLHIYSSLVILTARTVRAEPFFDQELPRQKYLAHSLAEQGGKVELACHQHLYTEPS